MCLWAVAAEVGGGSQQRHRRDHSSSLRNISAYEVHVPRPLRRIGARWQCRHLARPTQFLHLLSIPAQETLAPVQSTYIPHIHPTYIHVPYMPSAALSFSLRLALSR